MPLKNSLTGGKRHRFMPLNNTRNKVIETTGRNAEMWITVT